jgi:exopolysaccharide biosynthesis polyprenyl glycosylphosphotransferase
MANVIYLSGKIIDMRKRSELLMAVLQIPVDYVMLVVSFVLAYFLREGTGKPFSAAVGGYTYLNFMLIFLPIWLFIFFSVGLYSLRSDRKNWIDFGKILAACSAGAMVLIVIDFLYVKPIFPAKIVPIYGFLLALVLVSAGRVIMTIIQRLLARKGVGVYSILFIGEGKSAEELKNTLKKLKYRYKIVASVEKLTDMSLSKISKISEKKHIDTIIVADSNSDDEILTEIISFCQSEHIGYQFMPSMSGMYTSKILSTQIGAIPILELRRTPIEGWGRIIKRLFDVIMSTIVAILTLPVQLIIYLTIKLKEPGPAFYMHECYGRNGKKINVYKFRTMKSEYSLGPKFGGRTIDDVLKKLPEDKAEEFRKTAKIKDDPRVGKLGRLLRKTSLDELPQLYNVIKGDLSLVGPRPLPESELKLLGGEENLARIVTIRPGITGLWQVSGRNDLEYSERVKLNIYYIENWSLWLDIKILFSTVWQALFERNGI